MGITTTRVLPEALIGATRSRVGPVTDAMLADVAAADLIALDKSRSPSGRVKRRSCVEKEASGRREALRRVRILRAAQDEEIHAYPCGFCARWHVGHGIDIPADLRGETEPDLPVPVGPPVPPVIDTTPAALPHPALAEMPSWLARMAA